MERDEATLLDVFRAARLCQEFLGNLTEEEFLSDEKTQSAVLHQLMVLGEAVKRLSREFRAAHPEIPWGPMAGMRDHLVHAYDAVDLGEVWKTASGDIPSLRKSLEPLLPGPAPKG